MSNTIEALAFFAAAQTANTLGGGNDLVANVFSIAFVALRILYLIAYYVNWPTTRTIFWSLAMSCVVGLFINPFATTDG
jgi:uncharacterized MAPEG superfamily protein